MHFIRYARCIVVVAAAWMCFLLSAPCAAQTQRDEVSFGAQRYTELIGTGRHREAEQFGERQLAEMQSRYGPTSTQAGRVLLYMGTGQQLIGGNRAADAYLRRALAIAQGGNFPDDLLLWIYTTLAQVNHKLYRVEAAHAAYLMAISLQEKLSGRADDEVETLTEHLASMLEDVGRFSEAEVLKRRVLTMTEKRLGPHNEWVGHRSRNLAEVLTALGRVAEAEALLRRAVQIHERNGGPDNPHIAAALNGLASAYHAIGRPPEEMLPLVQRAFEIEGKKREPNQMNLAFLTSNLALIYYDMGRHAEADALIKRTIAFYERNNKNELSTELWKRGRRYLQLGRYVEAERDLKRALALFEKGGWENLPYVVPYVRSLAELALAQGRAAEAERLYQRGLTVREQLGPDHPSLAESLGDLASLYLATGRVPQAYDLAGRAGAILRRRIERVRSQRGATAEAEARSGDAAFTELARIGYRLAEQEPARVSALRDEGFRMAQASGAATASTAIAQMAVRLGAGDGELAKLVRESQDLGLRWRAADARLGEALSARGERDAAQIANVRKELETLEARLKEIDAALARSFPSYAELTSPKPLAIADAQALLKPDEALVAYLVAKQESYVWAVTREGATWARIDRGKEKLSADVKRLRVGLDVDVKASTEKEKLFDLGFANDLYAALLAPVEAAVKGKRHLIVVAAGPLTSLPFNVLVTEKPATAQPGAGDLAAYREASWLVKRQAVTVLPSVSSLRALRVLAKASPGARPMIGYGDPVFAPGAAVQSPQARAGSRPVAQRAFTGYWRGDAVDLGALKAGLAPLPETADELKAVARKLGASESDIFLGGRATETAVKRADLAPYRVVYFATHGLVAGEVKGLAEPALALSLPERATELDDGLLTAGEVAQLRLNADWVVLSACNTAAGDRPEAEALSGLARAFFYAGARALLVSHWAVGSDAAVRLTTLTFDALQKKPGASRAQALRQAMLAYMEDKADAWNGYPALWAPFMIVGEGG
jgi:CHAT domain-containing protein